MNTAIVIAICNAAPLAEQIIISGRRTPKVSMLVPLTLLSEYHKALRDLGTVKVGQRSPQQDEDGYPALEWGRLVLQT